MKLQSILLKPRGEPSPGAQWADASFRRIELTDQDDQNWYGKPVANPVCSVLTWPKCAWEEAGIGDLCT